jgi:hypothetical protein
MDETRSSAVQQIFRRTSVFFGRTRVAIGATNTRPMPPISPMVPEQLHVTSRSAPKAEQLSLIIPNASTHGPPTSSAVLANLGNSGAVTDRFPAKRVKRRDCVWRCEVSCSR